MFDDVRTFASEEHFSMLYMTINKNNKKSAVRKHTNFRQQIKKIAGQMFLIYNRRQTIRVCSIYPLLIIVDEDIWKDRGFTS